MYCIWNYLEIFCIHYFYGYSESYAYAEVIDYADLSKPS